jgi:hypothetical protein
LASDVWVSSITGDDNSNGLAPDTPVKSFAKARMISQKQMQPTVIHLDGTFYETLQLDSPLDSDTTWSSWDTGNPATLSGGIPLADLQWIPSTKYPPPVLMAKLPPNVPTQGMYSLFDGKTGRRLPLAREPNGDCETMMQPIGWALARRNINRTLPPPTAKSKLYHYEGNNSNFPVWGRDFDPRNPPIGYVYYTEGGGAASWSLSNRTFWGNKTVPGGLMWIKSIWF